MSTGGQKRTRSERVAALELPPSRVTQLTQQLQHGDVLLRLGLCLVSALALLAIARGWSPPFSYRTGQTPTHDIVARVEFRELNPRNPNEYTIYRPGQTLARGGDPLVPEHIGLLRLEHQTLLAERTRTQQVLRGAAFFAVLVALYAVCGYYVVFRERRVWTRWRRLLGVLILVPATVAVSYWPASDVWRPELVPPAILGMTLAIAYSKELALLLAGVASLIIALALGYGLGELLVLAGVVGSSVLLLGRIRSRSKLIKVGLASAGVALLLSIAAGVLAGQPLGTLLLATSARNALLALSAGFLMTGLLPVVERVFGVLTQISLLELGDAAHPLLQELVRRAPGTYNHSITVGSLGEAAAEAIGANGLLVRVGAYFHDIGKMFKPSYFVENSGQEASRHEALMPAMSTLIIIAHVKDGADLARQHHLPQPIIDFIEQHHGTTLVEYFFRRASQQSEADPHAATVEEAAFRYPGPKPQSREAAVLMLADAVESASRVLTEPTPARIESLVEELTQKRLNDGQFDECGMSFRQLKMVQDSLVKSLTGVYHARVKYPDQRTA